MLLAPGENRITQECRIRLNTPKRKNDDIAKKILGTEVKIYEMGLMFVSFSFGSYAECLAMGT